MPEKISPGDTALAASILCHECGLCCTGDLFSHVSLAAEEADSFRELGISLNKRSDGTFNFDQPCRCFVDNACTVYENRPARCRDYHCIVQRDVMNGSATLEIARRIVGVVKGNVKWLAKNIVDKKSGETAKINLRNFLFSYQEKMLEVVKKRRPTESEYSYIKYAFEHAKLIDRYFHQTRILTNYASLIQTLDAGTREPKA